ncbi:YIP1 family protein [Alteromonas aestuariivivens]|uniref:YIP1 family protein n=1 Tax=Alteromonas aestuariivivens TaxID=1938339 RepID=A0A3D8M3I1_9ALTE|nr:Yip1 family protein [Alteromonas aestuariivivens]RDV24297.1 YIP1 family protein [Alteromonas aestuariivivens]
MILNHLIGIYTHPKEEWQSIDRKHESYFYALSHIAVIALIPSIVGYYSAAHLGWNIGAGDLIKLTPQSALTMAVAMYFGLIAGVIALAFLIHELANAFEAKPTYTQSLELAAYTATPLFMVGFAGLYPELWFVMTAGLVGLTYSVYLLYSGVPILMHMHQDKGFIYSSSVVTCGLVLLVILMASTVILWSMGLGPVYVH